MSVDFALTESITKSFIILSLLIIGKDCFSVAVTIPWLELLNNKDILNTNNPEKSIWGHILAMFFLENSGISCKKLANKYNIGIQFITQNYVQFAKCVYKATNCPLYHGGYWAILFLARKTTKKEEGSFILKLRPELYDALTEFNILRYLPNDNSIAMEETTKYYNQFEYKKINELPKQTIYFGTPGSGKSYKIKRIEKEENTVVLRTTFHPDTDYASFIGSYKPKMLDDGKTIGYEFVPQIFTNA